MPKPQWFEFSADYDHYWPNRSVTAFKKGMVVFVKDEVVDAAKRAGAGKVTSKPKDGDEKHVTTQASAETKRIRRLTGNPVLSNRDEAFAATAPAPVDRVVEDGGSVTGKALSPASGGGQEPEDQPNTVVETGEPGERIDGPKTGSEGELSPVQTGELDAAGKPLDEPE